MTAGVQQRLPAAAVHKANVSRLGRQVEAQEGPEQASADDKAVCV